LIRPSLTASLPTVVDRDSRQDEMDALRVRGAAAVADEMWPLSP
jgi:hypothetical protein